MNAIGVILPGKFVRDSHVQSVVVKTGTFGISNFHPVLSELSLGV